MLKNRNVLLGVTGSIAAYKCVDLARRIIDRGARVKVVMTEAACRFITPYVFETVTGSPVETDLFKDPFSHINLSKESDLFIVAPATANTINKFSCGIADNLMTNLWLTHEGNRLIAPAMNHRMYRNKVVQDSIKKLRKAGVIFVGPEKGSLACGEEGKGRMVEILEIIEAAESALSPKTLKKHNIIVTAGPTVEQIDPVRYISNRSSGKMGYAVAQAAARRGADVTLISGPTSLIPPGGVKVIPVRSSEEMRNAVLNKMKRATSVIMAAAVADYAPVQASNVKLRKKEEISLELRKNRDILMEVGKKKGKRFIIGFAAETGRKLDKARQKLSDKNLDLLVFNDVTEEGAGFDVDTNIVTLINKEGREDEYPLMSKMDVADIILDRIPSLEKGGK